VELLKLFFSPSTTEAAKEKAVNQVIDNIKLINAALKKAEDTDGDTKDIEDIINKPKR
jgi:hypothetical protein